MSYSYSYQSTNGGSGAAITMCILSLLIALVLVIATWKVYEKAGKPGWAVFVPFYNTYVLFKLTWGNGWMFLTMLIPVVNFVIAIVTYVKLAKVFGKTGLFACGLIFLNPIFMCILGFGDAEYTGNEGNSTQGNSRIAGNMSMSGTGNEDYTSTRNVNSTNKFCTSCGKPLGGARFCPNCGTVNS